MAAPDVRVPFLSLKPGEDDAALRAAINRVIDRGWFILGPELEAFEAEFAAASGAAHAVGVNTGTIPSKTIREAILRHEIEHPVVNDPEHYLWGMIGVRSWPTVVLIDPEGNLVYGRPGEFKAEEFVEILDEAIPFYEKAGTLSHKPLHFEQLSASAPKTPLRYPGKILADEPGNRLFISDSNHNRIVITSLDGKLIDIIGTGAMGKAEDRLS